jgi:hypothetical protein
MESGEITDPQITASSSFDSQSVGPQNARFVFNQQKTIKTSIWLK